MTVEAWFYYDLVALYVGGMVPTHLAIKHMRFEMSTVKRVVALVMWPWFIAILVFLDIFSDALKDAQR